MLELARLHETRQAGQPAVFEFAAAGLPPPPSLVALHARFARAADSEASLQRTEGTASAHDVGRWLDHIRHDLPFDERRVVPVAQQVGPEVASLLGVAHPRLPGVPLQPPRLWLGVSSYHTPAHADDADNFVLMMSGAKTFWCSPPTSWAALRPRCIAEQCWASVDYAEAVPVTNLTVRAGEILYLPAGWFHRVTNLGPTVMVNFWTGADPDAARARVRDTRVAGSLGTWAE
jgi:hypothetical protein